MRPHDEQPTLTEAPQESADTPPKPRRLRTVGFILVGVLILGLIVPLITDFRFLGGHHGRDGYHITASGQIKELEKAISLFKLEAGRLPVTLNELIEPVGIWEEGLLYDIPTDPWGGEYIYSPAGGRKRPYVILSRGKDGRLGTEDDFSNESVPGRTD